MGTIKSECVHAKTYLDCEQAAREIFEHIAPGRNRTYGIAFRRKEVLVG